MFMFNTVRYVDSLRKFTEVQLKDEGQVGGPGQPKSNPHYPLARRVVAAFAAPLIAIPALANVLRSLGGLVLSLGDKQEFKWAATKLFADVKMLGFTSLLIASGKLLVPHWYGNNELKGLDFDITSHRNQKAEKLLSIREDRLKAEARAKKERSDALEKYKELTLDQQLNIWAKYGIGELVKIADKQPSEFLAYCKSAEAEFTQDQERSKSAYDACTIDEKVTLRKLLFAKTGIEVMDINTRKPCLVLEAINLLKNPAHLVAFDECLQAWKGMDENAQSIIKGACFEFNAAMLECPKGLLRLIRAYKAIKALNQMSCRERIGDYSLYYLQTSKGLNMFWKNENFYNEVMKLFLKYVK